VGQIKLPKWAKYSCQTQVAHLRWFLNAIFKLAMSDGLVVNNQAAELRIPRNCQPGRAMRPLTEEEVNQYLEVFGLREKLIVRMAIFEGMRPGEILALRWKSVRDEMIRVEQRVYKRLFDTPKNGKARDGATSDGTLALLKQWAGLAQDPSPDGSFSRRRICPRRGRPTTSAVAT
jgi:integrase